MKAFFQKIGNWFKNHKPTKRRIIQLYAALLMNANIKGFFNGQIYQGPTKNFCTPGLNCYSCPGAIAACPLGALQNALIESKTRTPAYIFGIIILFGLLLGRTICGFLCPVGLGQELLYKIKTPKLKKNRATRILSYFKYVLLVGLVVILPMAFAIPGFCEYICPAGTLEGGVGLLANPNNSGSLGMLGPLFTWKFTVLVLVVVAAIFIYRVFCRFLCPLGALYGFFCKIALLGVKLDQNKCTDCGLCVAACKMDIKHVGDHECIHCGACIAVCPAKAITWKGSKLFVRGNEEDMPAATEVKPLLSMLKRDAQPIPETVGTATETVVTPTENIVKVEMKENPDMEQVPVVDEELAVKDEPVAEETAMEESLPEETVEETAEESEETSNEETSEEIVTEEEMPEEEEFPQAPVADELVTEENAWEELAAEESEETSNEETGDMEEVAEETTPEAPQKERKGDVLLNEGDYVRVWCPKCGRRLRVQIGKKAFMCPGCTTLLQTRKTAKLFLDVEDNGNNEN